MPEHNQGQLGGTMRLGKRQTIFKTQDSIMRHLYGNENMVEERHRHRYEVNPAMIKEFEDAGMTFVGHDSGKFTKYLHLQCCSIENQQSPIYLANLHFSRHTDEC